MNFKDLPTTEKIDAVLEHLNNLYTKEREEEHKNNVGFDDAASIYKKTWKGIANAINYNWEDSYGNELQLILDYLTNEEKYIVKESDKFYSIKYAGKLFIEAGGYTQRERSQKINDREVYIRTFLLTYGTVLAGVGGVGLCVIEIYKLLPHCNCH